MTTAAEWDRLAQIYAERSGLLPQERTLLRRLRDRLPMMDMLDLGIGAGRTTEIFAALVRSYVGIDYSEAMIGAARRRLGAEDDATLAVADARDLARWHGRGFDLVLFSFNGIDYVDIDDRERILGEVLDVISPAGIFAFSTHSLDALPLSVRLTRPSRRDPIRSPLRSFWRAARLAAVNRALALEEARARGWALIRDGAHDFSISATMYVDPRHQLRQLRAAGFAVEDVLGASGASIDPEHPGREPHLFYVCGVASDNRRGA